MKKSERCPTGKAGRHHADDDARTGVGGERSIENVATPAEASLPELVAQDDDAVASAHVFGLGVGTADRRVHADRVERVERERHAGHLERTAVDQHRHPRRTGHGEMLERLRSLAPRCEVRRRDDVAGDAAARRFPDGDDAVGIAIRQRLEDHGPHDAEDGRRRADAQGQREHRRGGESRRLAQHPQTVADVPDGVVDERRADFIACGFARALAAAEPQEGLPAGLVRCEAGADVLLGLSIEVKRNLFVEPALEPIAAGHRSQPSPGAREAVRHVTC
jgi:hypothetical protein